MMTSIHSSRSVIGIIGNIISLGLFLSPTPTFVTIVTNGEVGLFSPLPYLATFLSCCIWVLYAFVKPGSLLILTINCIGVTVECVYLSIFLFFAPNDSRFKVIKILVAEIFFVIAVVLSVMLFAHTSETRAAIVGILAIVFTIGMYAAPLSVLNMVIQTQSIEYLSFGLSFASLLNGIFWFAYGMLPFDVNIAIPNALGILSGTAQLIVIAKYYNN